MSKLRNQMIQQMELKGYSPMTIKTYIGNMASLAGHFKLSPDLISIDEVRNYLHAGITANKFSHSWLNQTVSALKFLYCEILKREWSYLDLPRCKHDKKLPQVLAREELKTLLQVTTNIKHRAIFMLAYSGGLRISEIRCLKPSDIDSKRMMIRIVQAKGRKDRYTILSPVALEMLRLYWKKYRPAVWLFETPGGNAISSRAMQLVFKKRLAITGIKKDLTFHSLRHSFATHLMEQGVALPVIQQLLGHTSLRTTGIYLHVQQYSIETVRSPLDTFSI